MDLPARSAIIDQVVHACVKGGMKLQFALMQFQVDLGDTKSLQYRQVVRRIK